MSTITTVTIGRNIKDTPMPPSFWNEFRANVEDALNVAAVSTHTTIVVPVQTFVGTGIWEGTREESGILTIITDGMPDIEWLRDRLSVLSGRWCQDAIALSVGESELVTPH